MVASGVTLFAWYTVQSTARSTANHRLNQIGSLLIQAPYPLTDNVLRQIVQLSDAQVVVLDKDRHVVLSSGSLFANQVRRPEFGLKEGELGSIEMGNVKYDSIIRSIPESIATTSPHNPNYRYLVVMQDQQQRIQSAWRSLGLPVITGIGSILATALVATLLARRIGNRIEKLESQVNRIAEGGFEVLAVEGPLDAVGKLAVSVNKMSNQLESAQKQIARDERARLINLIASGMAHQLRNSLTGAILLLQTVMRSHADSEEIPMALQQLRLAQESIKRLLAMRFTEDKNDYRTLTVATINHELREYVQSMASHMNVALTWDTPDDVGKIAIAEGEAIVGAILNLLLNAIEACGPGGEVKCQVRLTDTTDSVEARFDNKTSRKQFVEWFIVDNGPGPASEVALTMEEPFVTTKKEGVGLGLPMAIRTAKRFGGSLNWNRKVDWTIFEFRIPLEAGSSPV